MKKVLREFSKVYLCQFFNKSMIGLVILLIVGYDVFGQNVICGTLPTEQDLEAYKQSIIDLQRNESSASRANVLVAVRPIVFTNLRNESNVNKDELKEALQKVSSRFEKFGVQLDICEPIFIQNSSLYDFDIEYELGYINRFCGDSVINFFVVNALKYNGREICGVGLFPFKKEKRFIAVNSKCLTQDYTVPHEFGHALGLYHTHEESMGKELVQRTNCTFAGDMLCDTPADPGLGSHNVDTLCNYFGMQRDNNFKLYTPDPSNLMSYAPEKCVKHFSPEQMSLMKLNAEKYYSNYFKGCTYNDISINSEFRFTSRVLSGYDFTLPYRVYTNNSIELFDYKVIASVIDPNGEEMKIYEETFNTSELSKDGELNLSLPNDLKTGGYVLHLKIELPNGIRDQNYLDNDIYLVFDIDYSNLDPKRVFYDIQNGVIQVYLKKLDPTNITIEIYDATGKRVDRYTEIQLQTGPYVNAINADNLSSGIYLVKVITQKEMFTTLLAVAH